MMKRSLIVLAAAGFTLSCGLVQADEKIQQIYDTKCALCHASGVAGAPKLHDQEAWAPRLEEEGADGLLAIAKKGINAMPPMGTCMECSDEDLAALIEFMSSEAK